MSLNIRENKYIQILRTQVKPSLKVQSVQGLYCVPFRLQLLDILQYANLISFKFRITTVTIVFYNVAVRFFLSI